MGKDWCRRIFSKKNNIELKNMIINKKILLILFCAFAVTAKAQNTSVEKSITGIQIGFLGVWFFNEFKLTNTIALRTELGLDAGSVSNGSIDVFAPGFALEPRIYYNLNKRARKGKNVKNNSANFFAITTRFSPDWFVISSRSGVRIPKQILIAPKWGIRRNISEHFNYELGIGLGVRSYFGEKIGFGNKSYEASSELHIRIGYHF